MIKALILSVLLGVAATSAYAEDKSANATPAEAKPEAANRKLVQIIRCDPLQDKTWIILALFDDHTLWEYRLGAWRYHSTLPVSAVPTK
jgi:hypothetical protein